MNKKHLLVILLMLAFAVLASGCGSRSMMTAAGWPGVTADDESVYVAFNNHVYAINLDNGSLRWRFPAEPETTTTFYAAPALDQGNQLIAGSYDSSLYSLDPANGQLLWQYEAAEGRYIASPIVSDGLIFAPSGDNELHALDLDGFPQWAQPFETAGPNWSQPVTDQECDCVFLASMDQRVYAIDPQSGRQIWVSEELGGAIVSAPAISPDRLLFVGTFYNEMIALNADTGTIEWRFSTQEWVWDDPVVYDSAVYFGDLSGTFYALDTQTGKSLWQVQPGSGAIVGKPLVTAEGIYFTTDEGALIFVTHAGVIQWNQTFEGQLDTGPVAAGDLIILAANNADTLIYAVNQNGILVWSFTPGK
ncbi:MAG: PQQ-binding-like beta-propeller repeat protein [Anaerolineales bacterium]|nr:PQQ-binding-like beta-propeller repeat protein [Anaerolineales bacterium]